MKEREYWPEGDIDFAVADVDGDTFIKTVFETPDGDTPTIALGFKLAHFVAVSDHMKMVADRLVAERAGGPIS